MKKKRRTLKATFIVSLMGTAFLTSAWTPPKTLSRVASAPVNVFNSLANDVIGIKKGDQVEIQPTSDPNVHRIRKAGSNSEDWIPVQAQTFPLSENAPSRNSGETGEKENCQILDIPSSALADAGRSPAGSGSGVSAGTGAGSGTGSESDPVGSIPIGPANIPPRNEGSSGGLAGDGLGGSPSGGDKESSSESASGEGGFPMGGDVADSEKIYHIADRARGEELIELARQKHRLLREAATADQKSVAEPFQKMPTALLGQRLTEAAKRLGDTARTLEMSLADTSYPSGALDSSERHRFRNFFLNARDKADIASQAIRNESEKPGMLGMNSPFEGFAGKSVPNPLARSKSMAEIFGEAEAMVDPTSNDALTNRLVMYNALPDTDRVTVGGKLRLFDQAKVTLPGGKSETIPLLHNGYILGGSKTAVDCSSMVSSLLPADARRGRYTTLDLHSMWVYGRTGVLPVPPKRTVERSKQIRTAADAFVPLDLYRGDSLVPGDLLVYRTSWSPTGHVFLVKAYHPKEMKVEVIEAAQSAGTIRERMFPLTADPPTAPNRAVRAGLYLMRLKSTTNKACTYDGRAQARQRKGT